MVWRRVLGDGLVKATLEHRFDGVDGEGSAVVEYVGAGGIDGCGGVSPGELKQADFLAQGGGGVFGPHSADEAAGWGADAGVGVEQDGDSVMVGRDHWGPPWGQEVVSLGI